MDPWQPQVSVPSARESFSTNADGLELHNGDIKHDDDSLQQHQNLSEHSDEVVVDAGQPEEENKELSFSDNFRPFIKLPDSQEYLDSLEKKLKKIQKGGKTGPSAESILRSLEQTKQSCMLKLLSNSVEQLTTDGDFFEELKVNPLLKKLAPERQALSTEELVHLLTADQLEILLSGNNEPDEIFSDTVDTTTTETAEGSGVGSHKVDAGSTGGDGLTKDQQN